jgi:hypothetical protein
MKLGSILQIESMCSKNTNTINPLFGTFRLGGVSNYVINTVSLQVNVWENILTNVIVSSDFRTGS